MVHDDAIPKPSTLAIITRAFCSCSSNRRCRRRIVTLPCSNHCWRPDYPVNELKADVRKEPSSFRQGPTATVGSPVLDSVASCASTNLPCSSSIHNPPLSTYPRLMIRCHRSEPLVVAISFHLLSINPHCLAIISPNTASCFHLPRFFSIFQETLQLVT